MGFSLFRSEIYPNLCKIVEVSNFWSVAYITFVMYNKWMFLEGNYIEYTLISHQFLHIEV